MSVRDCHNKRVTFDATDDIKQKIDKLMTKRGKLVAEDEGQSKLFKLWVYQSNRGRRQNRSSYPGRFRSNNAYRGCSVYNQDFRGRTRYNFDSRIIIIIEGMIKGIDFMIEIGVDHLKDRIEVGEMTEV